VTLVDGVTATLDARTRVTTRGLGNLKAIAIGFGHVGFDISRRLERPLEVLGAMVKVSSRQGSFTMRVDGRRLELVVLQGEAEMHGHQQSQRIQAGSKARFNSGALLELTSLSADDAARSDAWKSGHLAVNGETVGEVADAFNRYNRTRVAITSDAINRQKLVGYFRIDDPRAFADAVATSFGGSVENTSEGLTVVPRSK
jgi:transmembrane sensor